MALSTDAKNGMLEVIDNYLDNLYLLKALPTIDTAISGYSANYAGYTSSGARFVAMTWNTASGGSKVSSNSPSSAPIMFAVPQGTTLAAIAYVDTADGVIRAYFPVSGSYTSIDGSYYISSETFSFV